MSCCSCGSFFAKAIWGHMLFLEFIHDVNLKGSASSYCTLRMALSTQTSTAVSNINGAFGGHRHRSHHLPLVLSFHGSRHGFWRQTSIGSPCFCVAGEYCTISCSREVTQPPLPFMPLGFRNSRQPYGESGRDGCLCTFYMTTPNLT